MEKETCYECGKELKIGEEATCTECQEKEDDENRRYANHYDECTPMGYYLSDGEYIDCKTAYMLGLI